MATNRRLASNLGRKTNEKQQLILEAHTDLGGSNLSSKGQKNASIASKHLVANQILNSNRQGSINDHLHENKNMHLHTYDNYTRNQATTNMLGGLASMNQHYG